MDHVAIVRKGIQVFPDVAAVDGAAEIVGGVVEEVRLENALVTGVGRGFRKGGGIDVVGLPPRKVRPVRPGFQEVVLEIVLGEQNGSLVIAEIGKLFQPVPVPRVEHRQVVSAQPVPGPAGAAASERLFVERRDHISIRPAHAGVIIAPAVVP